MNTSKLPSLRSIQAFEAVGRAGSVTAAAAELGVSPGAVTQQLQALQKHLKLRLLQQRGRGVELTPWGSLYLQRVSAGMQQIRKAREDVHRAQHSNHLVLSALPSLAIGLLGPMMFKWKEMHPGVNVLIDGKDPEPRMDDGEADFRVSYGNRHRRHAHYTQLFTDRVMAVASPALLPPRKRLASPRDLLKLPLIGVDWGPEYLPLPTWRDWFAAAGSARDEISCDLTFTLPTGAIYAAIEGHGVALAQHSMAASAIESGALVQVFPTELPLPEAHFLAWNRAALDKSFGASFHRWLIGVCRRL
jgi:LysR family glycine cleavage system transcriptional activator